MVKKNSTSEIDNLRIDDSRMGMLTAVIEC